MADEKTPLPLSEPHPPDAALEGPTWEDDETTATGFLRALFVCLAGGLLAWAQWHAPEGWMGTIGENWLRWIWTSVVFNFALPAGLIYLFFGQDLMHQPWLKDQKHNAWNYGWNFRGWKRHLKIALAVWGVALIPLIIASHNVTVGAVYTDYLPPRNTPLDWAYLIATLVVYMFCWEWFFRGFALFGIAQGFGVILAIALQTIAFGLAHIGKSPPEMWGAFAGGAALGVLCWREKSFVPGFLIHTLVHVTWVILV